MAKSVFNHVEDELRYWPGVTYEQTRKARHPAVILRFNNQQRTMVIPGTSSDWRSTKNNVTQIRQFLREMGATRLERLPSSKREEHLQEHHHMAKKGVVARLSMTDASMHFTIPKDSPIYGRFADENDKPKGHWTFEMRSNPDPKGLPFFAVVKQTLPKGVKRVRGVAAGSFTKVSQVFAIVIAGNSLPNVFKHGPFGATALELYHDTKDIVQFKMPTEKKAVMLRGDKRLEALTKPPEPEIEEPVVEAPAVEPPAPTPEPPVAAPEERRAAGTRSDPVVIQPTAIPLSVERAIRYLNKRKTECGSDLTFTIVEGGFIRAVQRMM